MRPLLALVLALAAFSGAAAETPQRIVSIGGSVTEVLYALGLGDRIIAVDSTSLYPPAAQDLAQVGYVRALAAEPIIAMDADLVLAEGDAGPPAVLQQLREAGVPVTLIADTPSPEGVVEKVREVAAAVGMPAEGAALAGEIEAAFAALAARREAVAERPTVLFLLSHSGAPMAAGRGTSADAIIRLAGGRNVVEGFSGYKPLSPEMAVQAAPEVLLLTTQGVEAMGGAQRVAEHPALGLTPAAREGRIYAYDALLLLGFGPRTPEAAALFMEDLQGPAAASAD